MDLNTPWFILIGVLFTGFFILEGFDYGVGILVPFLGKEDRERRQIINTIGPFWDANEVWIITAGGAMFAAFPHWYATMFSGFYLALFLTLVALIVRGVAFEFRSKDKHPRWRKAWDWGVFFGSAVPALLWGVAMANLLGGTPIDADKHYVGGFFDLLNPYTLIAGLASLTVFMTHGAIFLNLKTTGVVRERAQAMTKKIGPIATVMVFGFILATYFMTDFVDHLGVNPGLVPIMALGSLLAAGWLIHLEQMGWAFVTTCATILFSTMTIFVALFPRVMVSSLNPEWSLTVYNASSSPYTLKIMSIVALIFVPIVLVYQAWTYWIFRHRVTLENLEY